MAYKIKGSRKWKLERNTLVMVFAEILGTAFLLFVGCMANVGSMSVVVPSTFRTPFNFGLLVNGIIMAFGHISGAHINPAVTLASMLFGQRSIPTGIIFMAAQICGAIIGYGTLTAITPSTLMNQGYSEITSGVCMTLVNSGLNSIQGLVVEIICTVVLVIVNCAAWDSRNAHNSDSTSLRVGLTVTALSVAADPYTGCSMNPARSFAPALWNNDWTLHWVYWVGPFTGAIIGAVLYRSVFSEKTISHENAVV